MKIIGFCRFSFFGPSDTRLNYEDEKAAFKVLYSDQRMENRFFLFENLLLPSIAAQTDKDFTLTIITSEVMPKKYRQRLAKICKSVPQIKVFFAKTTVLKNELRPLLIEAAEDDQYELVQFRIDDDDALSCQYIERLRSLTAQSPAQKLITMPQGLLVYNAPNQQGIGNIFRPYTGAGFAFHAIKGRHRQVFQFAHNQAKKFFNSVMDPTFCSHIQSAHISSDTVHKQSIRLKKYLWEGGNRNDPETIEKILASNFPFLDYAKLEKIGQDMNGDSKTTP